MKLIILDRDGVINQDSDAFVKSPDEWIALPGSLQAIARLTQAGWKVVVATNQSGLARGLFDMDTLNAIHAKMRRELAAGGSIDAVFLCPHGPDDNCVCRKPLPGMFEQIGARYDANLNDVPAVGDFAARPQASSRRLRALAGADRQRREDAGRAACRPARASATTCRPWSTCCYKTKRPDPMARLRSLLYAIFLIVTVIPYAFACVLWLPLHLRYKLTVGRAWRSGARVICGIRWQVKGWENLPDGPAVILSKHQSAWETLFFPAYMPREVCFYKKELHMVPFFGWPGAAAHDRHRPQQGPRRFEQVVAQGRKRMDEGRWPALSGRHARAPPGRPLQDGGALLASRTGARSSGGAQRRRMLATQRLREAPGTGYAVHRTRDRIPGTPRGTEPEGPGLDRREMRRLNPERYV